MKKKEHYQQKLEMDFVFMASNKEDREKNSFYDIKFSLTEF